MVIRITSAVDTVIHAVSPLLGTGVAAGAAADAASAGAAAAGPDASAAGAEAACAIAAPEKPNRATPRATAARSFLIMCLSSVGSLPVRWLKRVFAGLAGADAQDLLDR